MTPAEIATSVESFVTSYRAAFEHGDARAVARHYGERVHVASDTGAGVRVDVLAGAEWQAAIERLLAGYGALGVTTAVPRELAVAPVSGRLAQARVVWALADRTGRALYAFCALYTLARDPDATGGAADWRIVAVAHDEVAQARPHLAHLRPRGAA